MVSCGSSPCPICFETVGDCWTTHKAWYHREDNHSWNNHSRCDAHDICWSCLAKHIEVQVLSEGKCSVRCPGAGCKYHLLRSDIDYAMWGSRAQNDVLTTLDRLNHDSCQERLKEMVFGTFSGKAVDWLLEECQPCPQCFVLSRRETGCNHIVCRCGCDFCFGCGAPSYEGECLCHRLDVDCRRGSVFFAAWLRASQQSTCDWLWENESSVVEEGPSTVMSTLGYWLWMAGADIPIVWDGLVDTPLNSNAQSILPSLKWADYNGNYTDEDIFIDYYSDTSDDEMFLTGDLEQDLSGHLRKEIYSRQTQRMLRQGQRRKAKKANVCKASDDKKADSSTVQANRTLF